MKYIISTLIVLLVSCQRPTRVVFLGDSITEMGDNKEGEGIYEGIQREYPKITGDLNSSDGQVTFVKQEQYEDFNDDENTIEIENLSLVDKEVELIKKALDKSNGKRKKAAKELGISERTLYRKIKQYNLE